MNLGSSKRGDLMLNKRSHNPEPMEQASTSNTITPRYVALLKEAEQTFNRRAIRNVYHSDYIVRIKQRKKREQKPKECLPALTIFRICQASVRTTSILSLNAS